MRPDGIVLEAPTSTIFWVDRRRAAHPGARGRDPRLDHPARSWSRRSTVAEGEYALADLLGASEAFLASTMREIQPIVGGRRASRSSAGPRDRPRRRRRSRARSPRRWARAGCMIELTDEQRLIAETARDFVDNEVVPRARDSDRAREVRHRARPAARRDGLPRRAGRRGVRRPRPRLPRLRADRRGGRPRRLGDADRRLGPDLARLRLDRALGQRGAEAALAAGPDLGRVVRLLRAHRARHGLRRRQPAHPGRRRSTAAGGSRARRCGSRSATSPTSR